MGLVYANHHQIKITKGQKRPLKGQKRPLLKSDYKGEIIPYCFTQKYVSSNPALA